MHHEVDSVKIIFSIYIFTYIFVLNLRNFLIEYCIDLRAEFIKAGLSSFRKAQKDRGS